MIFLSLTLDRTLGVETWAMSANPPFHLEILLIKFIEIFLLPYDPDKFYSSSYLYYYFATFFCLLLEAFSPLSHNASFLLFPRKSLIPALLWNRGNGFHG